MSQPWDYIAKLVCIGDSGTGKSSLTIRLCEGRFSTHHDVTIGVEFGSRIVSVGPPPTFPSPHNHNSSSAPSPPSQKRMKLSLWDTAGQETYKSITRSYFRGASGALLVYDITRRSTFEHATEWLHDLRQIAEEGIVVVLVGNKRDLAGPADDDNNKNTTPPTTTPTSTTTTPSNTTIPPSRAVSRAEAESWCRQNNVLRYVETSAKSGEGVESAFLDVAQKIYENVQRGKYDLNDRRSGVKGPGAGVGGGGGGKRNGTVRLGGGMGMGMNDVGPGGGGRGGCC